MLKDIPYSTLTHDKRTYEIMLLRDQHGNTFTDIAKECEISTARVVQIYNKQKVKQARLYINHIAISLGLESATKIREVYAAAYECYQERTYALAYLEKKYEDILTGYRNGEPGMPAEVIENMPPFTPELTEHTIARVIEMRENERASFVSIAKELHITRAKAKRTYEMFYHEQVLNFIEALEDNANSYEEKAAIWNYWFKGYKSSKKCYDRLIEAQNDTE